MSFVRYLTLQKGARSNI